MWVGLRHQWVVLEGSRRRVGCLGVRRQVLVGGEVRRQGWVGRHLGLVGRGRGEDSHRLASEGGSGLCLKILW